MKGRTTAADKYLLEYFYGTCYSESRAALHCSGVEISCEQGNEYSYLDVVLDGHKKCGNCPHLSERQGFYYGKGEYSADFGLQEYVTINNVRSQEEFKSVCENVNSKVRGMVIRAAISDAAILERFNDLEFVTLENQRISCFWDVSHTPKLKCLTIWNNRHLKSLNGLENAQNLECLQFYSSFSDVNIKKIDSLKPISKLPNLKEIVLSAIEPTDHNIEYLIRLPKLDYLWISPNVFPIECYAEFEAKRFKLSEEYGIYHEDEDDIFPYGKGKRIMHTSEQKKKYLKQYNELMQQFK